MMISHAEKERYRFGKWGPQYLFHGINCEGGEILIAPGKRLDVHFHRIGEEFFYVVEGNPTFIIDNKEHPVNKGNAIYVQPGEKHTIKNDTNLEVKIVFVKPIFQNDRFQLEEAVK